MELFLFAFIGFFAQIVDSSIGMAFGTLSSTLLLTFGFPPQALSATVHTAEIFSGGTSAFAHYRLKNIDWDLLKRLSFPAITGAIIGSFLIIYFPGDILKPFISGYFVVVGLIIIAKALQLFNIRPINLRVALIGFLGGFFDAFGGAGWGEFVSSGLILRGQNVQTAVGSLNAVEFLITTAISIVFMASTDVLEWQSVAALALGGMIAAPIGAWVCKRAPTKWLMLMVGVVVSLLGLKSLLGY
jgi:uncharacterized protein